MKLNKKRISLFIALVILQAVGCSTSSRQPGLHLGSYLNPHLGVRDSVARMPKIEYLKSINEKGIFMQKHDYSCGAASLATLLHFYFDEDVDELSLLNHIKSLFTSDQYQQIENNGLSFLELKTIASSLGYSTASVRLPAQSLQKIDRPVIVYVERDDYKHFAVYKGMVEDRVLLADPSRGNIRMSITRFLGEWDGRTFVLEKPDFSPSNQHVLRIEDYQPLRNELIALRSRLNSLPLIYSQPPVLGRRAP